MFSLLKKLLGSKKHSEEKIKYDEVLPDENFIIDEYNGFWIVRHPILNGSTMCKSEKSAINFCWEIQNRFLTQNKGK